MSRRLVQFVVVWPSLDEIKSSDTWAQIGLTISYPPLSRLISIWRWWSGVTGIAAELWALGGVEGLESGIVMSA